MREIGRMIGNKGRALTIIQMDRLIQDIGRMICSMDMEFKYLPVDTNMRGKDFNM